MSRGEGVTAFTASHEVKMNVTVTAKKTIVDGNLEVRMGARFNVGETFPKWDAAEIMKCHKKGLVAIDRNDYTKVENQAKADLKKASK